MELQGSLRTVGRSLHTVKEYLKAAGEAAVLHIEYVAVYGLSRHEPLKLEAQQDALTVLLICC